MAGPSPTIQDGEIHGRRGWVLENDQLRVALVRDGGHIAEVRLRSDNPRLSFNPLFVPTGGGYIGHMVCLPHYGPASVDERRGGLRGHGEAGAVEWHPTQPAQTNAGSVTFFYGAELPKTQYRIERAVTLRNGESAVHVQEWIENLAPFDRPYNHVQHATYGEPLVAPERSFLDLSGTKGMTDSRRTASNQWASSREFEWPNAPESQGGSVSLREFRAVPGGQVYTAVLSDDARPPGWFTLYNSDYPLLAGCVFAPADFPWISDWQNQPRTGSPGRIARGIEFGTSPFDEGLRRSVERGEMFGVPSYRWIGAKQRIATKFTIFLTEIPSGFAGVQDIRREGERIVIVERGSGREFSVPMAQP